LRFRLVTESHGAARRAGDGVTVRESLREEANMRVGVIGGGQLARMMIAPAVELGVEIRVLAEAEGMSAALATTAVGDYRDVATVLTFAREVDVVTFDHEHVPQEVLAALVDAGVAVHPGPDALRYAQDKLLMRERLAEFGLPVPDWARVTTEAEVDRFLAEHGGRAILKQPRGGYDGKGVRIVGSGAEASDWLTAGPLLIEELVDFRRELAQLVARRGSGDTVGWPLVETVQIDGVCSEVIAPAPHSRGRISEVAMDVALTIAERVGVIGVLAVELFETRDDRILINELAMRPHNSGHWTMDGSVTGQFEQPLRAVLDLPLGATGSLGEWAVMVNLLGGPNGETVVSRLPRALAEHPVVKVHTYGKAPRPGRKVGHVTAVGTDLDEVGYHARATAVHFRG